jgi:hypothetical protein
MFEKIAKFGMHPSRRTAPGFASFAPANDNRLSARVRRPRLVCRWSPVDGTGRLGCRWEIEGPDGQGDSTRAKPGGSFHKTVVESSHQPGRGTVPRLSDSLGLVAERRPAAAHPSARVARASLGGAIWC